MNYSVIKRDGRSVPFDLTKIINAISRSAKNLNLTINIVEIAEEVYRRIADHNNTELTVEQIQDLIEETLLNLNLIDLKNSYSNYRKERTRIRDLKSELMDTVQDRKSVV